MPDRRSLARVSWALLALSATSGCSAHNASEFGAAGGMPAQLGTANTFGDAGGAGDGGGIVEPIVCGNGTGAQCVTTCSGAATTTYSGTVYDPADTNPVYNVAVYVPASALPDLPSGATCGCSSLYPSKVLASATTDAHGTFVLQGVPVGQNVPVVVQAGKWRRVYSVQIPNACQSNTAPDHSLRLPRMASEGNLPDIAVSTGGADSLECLLLRVGVDPSELVAGASPAGHVHIFQGFAGATTPGGSPASSEALWDSTSDLLRNDVVLLSCEGEETANVTTASQQSLLDFADQGGRVFASHFHYVWFDQGPFDQFRLARWESGPQIVVTGDTSPVAADVDTTLDGGGPFPEGSALATWLSQVGALTNGQLPIWYARDNVSFLSAPPSTEWIHIDPGAAQAPGATQYFSVDTPVGASSPCGRVVYSDLHVSGGPGSDEPGVPPDYPDAGTVGTNRVGGIAPSGCAAHPLTPQEDALEFMLFDLSSCLIPIGEQSSFPR